jgi:hypothetical protein
MLHFFYSNGWRKPKTWTSIGSSDSLKTISNYPSPPPAPSPTSPNFVPSLRVSDSRTYNCQWPDKTGDCLRQIAFIGNVQQTARNNRLAA